MKLFGKFKNYLNYKRAVFFLNNFYLTRYFAKLKKLKNKQYNKRCFIIGNGPSLSVTDLEKLEQNKEITFAFNRIYLIFPDTVWRPTYYISQDEKMLANSIVNIEQFDLKHIFTPLNLKYFYNIKLARSIYFKIIYESYNKVDNKYRFSKNCAKGIYDARTVVYSAMQLAVYMGIKEIYLLGVDHSFNTSINNKGELIIDNSVKDYFSDNYNTDKENLYIPNTEKTNLTYQDAKYHLEKLGIKVYNATRGGKLEVFERIDFDSLIN